MSNNTKDVLAAIVVATITMFLVILLMGSVVLLGQTAGRNARGDTETVTGPAGTADQVPILAYHYIRGSDGPMRFLRVLGYVVLSLPLLNDNEVWTQSVDSFEKQMRYLHDNGYRTITLGELTRWQAGRIELPRRTVAITFDDGDRSVYEHAFPVLERYGFTATFFVVTSKVGQDWEGVSGLYWQELREMQSSGVFQIESHTHDMHYRVQTGNYHTPVFLAASKGEYDFEKYRNWQSAVLNDLGTSRILIRKHIGAESRYLAWPYGERNDEVDRVARSAGFSRVVSMEGGLNEIIPGSRVSRRAINRYGISARTSMHAFKKIILGTYDPPDA